MVAVVGLHEEAEESGGWRRAWESMMVEKILCASSCFILLAMVVITRYDDMVVASLGN